MQFAVNNTDGVAAKRQTVYNIKKEVHVKLLQRYGLGKCKLANMHNAEEKIVEMDIKARRRRGDNSDDYLGIVQENSHKGGICMHLYGKAGISLFADIAALGRLILY